MARWSGWLTRALDAFAGVLLVSLLGTVTLGIITRGLGDPLIWTDEASRFLMIWLAGFGWILVTLRGQHVRIRYFQARLQPLPRRALEVLIQLGMLLLGALVLWHGTGLVWRNIDLDATSLPMSLAWMYVPLLPAGLTTAVQALHDIVRHRPPPAGLHGTGPVGS